MNSVSVTVCTSQEGSGGGHEAPWPSRGATGVERYFVVVVVLRCGSHLVDGAPAGSHMPKSKNQWGQRAGWVWKRVWIWEEGEGR